MARLLLHAGAGAGLRDHGGASARRLAAAAGQAAVLRELDAVISHADESAAILALGA